MMIKVIFLPLFLFSIFTLLGCQSSFLKPEKEGDLRCDNSYEIVERKAEIIKSYGDNLSNIAKKRLYIDLRYEVEECISDCDGKKFKYCNDVSKKITMYNYVHK